MTFLNPMMLFGALAVAAPILLHLLNRRQARVVRWGAMRFLRASITARNRRIFLEELLLLLVRCAIPLFLAAAMARPFLTAGQRLDAVLAALTALGALVLLAAAAALWAQKKRRRRLLAAAMILAATAAAAVFYDRSGPRGRRGTGYADYALVIDASRSMALAPNPGSGSNFSAAVAAARKFIERMKPGDTACIVLAGPTALPLAPAPTYDPKPLLRALARRRTPLGGVMNLPAALDTAVNLLRKGRNPHRIIIVYTDGQRNGWRLDDPEDWRYLGHRFATLPFPARILVRAFPLPRVFANLAAADLSLSRDIIGTDRPVGIEAVVENTGAAPLRPDAVELLLQGQVVARRAGATAVPAGARLGIHFQHQFRRPGIYLLRARLHAPDDFPADDAIARAVQVLDTLPIRLVDGAPSPDPLGGAVAFMAVALRPDAGKAPPAAPGHSARAPWQRILRTLAAPSVIDAGKFAESGRIGQAAVVVLADVRSLPPPLARRLAEFVQDGGGLLLVPGEHADAAFYQSWRTEGGEPVCPVRLGPWREIPDSPLELAPETLNSPVLALVRQTVENQPDAVEITAYRTLEKRLDAAGVRIDGRLSNHAIFMAERTLGRGCVAALAVPLRPEAGNLPLLPAFVPFMDRLATHLAAAGGLARNLVPGEEAVFRFRKKTPESGGKPPGGRPGLLGEYFRGKNFDRRKLVRVDPAVDFDWGRQAPVPQLPPDRFSIRWSGWLRAPISGRLTLYVRSDDGCRLQFASKILVNEWKDQYPTEYSATVPVEKGQYYPLLLEYYENAGEALIRLGWSYPGQAKAAVPAAALRPAPAPGFFQPVGAAASARLPEDAAAVRTPHGRHVPARAEIRQGELRVTFADTAVPGVYRLRLSPALAALYGGKGLADPGLPFVVRDSPEESVLNRLSPADRRKLAGLAPLTWADSPDAVARLLFGEIRGQDGTAPLLWAVFVLAVIEVALTRWIALRRRPNPGADSATAASRFQQAAPPDAGAMIH